LCNKILNLNPESNINLIQIWKNKKIGNQKLEKKERKNLHTTYVVSLPWPS
jgi:hypothetical protein